MIDLSSDIRWIQWLLCVLFMVAQVSCIFWELLAHPAAVSNLPHSCLWDPQSNSGPAGSVKHPGGRGGWSVPLSDFQIFFTPSSTSEPTASPPSPSLQSRIAKWKIARLWNQNDLWSNPSLHTWQRGGETCPLPEPQEAQPQKGCQED